MPSKPKPRDEEEQADEDVAGRATGETPKSKTPKAPALARGAPRPVYLARPKDTQLLVETDAEVDLKGARRALRRGCALTRAGDTGAVGRFSAAAAEGNEFRLDLKGDVFSGVVLPSASTVCVMTLTGTDARIEHVMTEFMRARRLGNVMSSMGGRLVEGTLKPSELRGDGAAGRRGGAEEDAGSDAESGGGPGDSESGSDEARVRKRAKPGGAGAKKAASGKSGRPSKAAGKGGGGKPAKSAGMKGKGKGAAAQSSS